MIIYGLHPVLNIIKVKPKIIKRVFISRKLDLDILKTVRYEHTNNNHIDKLTKTTDHQGIACEISHFPYVDPDSLIERANKILILDHIEDPQNLGAILRNSYAFNIDLVIIPKDRACDITPAVIKASAGNAIFLNISKVTNINDFIRNLKEDFFTVYGFEGNGTRNLSQIKFTNKTALVFGSEGKGIKQLTKSLCDDIIKIEFNSEVGSLNVSSASAIVLYKLFMDLH